jgi:predicted ATPase
LDGGARRHGADPYHREAGIGKTRLVAELARRADNAGARTAVGADVDVGGEAPLATWQELVPQLARSVPPPPEQASWPAELGRLAPDIAARLGRDEPPPPVSSPELERLRVFDAVLHLVEWAADDRPVLLVAEDVHRADPASLQLAAHIGRRLAARPVLFVLTRRDKPDRPDADALLADLAGRGVEVAELELGPLSAVELAAVARSVADLADDAVEQVIRAADGNPLLAVESARALAAGRAGPATEPAGRRQGGNRGAGTPGAGPGRAARRGRPRAVRGRARRGVP